MKKQPKYINHGGKFLDAIRDFSGATGTLEAIIKIVWRELEVEELPDYPDQYVYDLQCAFRELVAHYMYALEKTSSLATESMYFKKEGLYSGLLEASSTDVNKLVQSVALIKKYFFSGGHFAEAAARRKVVTWAKDCLDAAIKATSLLIEAILEAGVSAVMVSVRDDE